MACLASVEVAALQAVEHGLALGGEDRPLADIAEAGVL
eukprot:CAMPEP_0119082340 /NCGR_PEP_ID=MMETSP1178-20130426/120808_1 /TAXON_ID=33656 /ORGANISM="unid sp, Strain CCMP2000" /LENGTH=37 /DNA_ID= /DNA_START= /DNA_END= /DNA_ORIENTATION=